MKQSLIIISNIVLSIILVSLLSGCASFDPRPSLPMSWFSKRTSEKQDEKKLADSKSSEKDGIDIQSKNVNPFKRNRKKNEENALASSEKDAKQTVSQTDLLIDQELADATESDRAEMKKNLRGKDIAVVRSVLNVWKNVRRVNDRPNNETKQAATDSFNSRNNNQFSQQQDEKQKTEEQLLLASLEREKTNNARTRELPSRAGLGASNPWGDSPFGRTNEQRSSRYPDQPSQQILAGHSTDAPFLPRHKAQNNQRTDAPFPDRHRARENQRNSQKLSHLNDNNSLEKEMQQRFPQHQMDQRTEKQSNRMQERFDRSSGNHNNRVQQTSAEQGINNKTKHLENLISEIENELTMMKQNPDTKLSNEEQQRTYIEKQVYLRMLYLMAGEQVRSFDAIPGIPSADQEFWRQLFWGMANYFDHTAMPDARTRATQTVTQLQQATLRLQAKANLQLRNLNFCHKIASYGNYEKFKQSEFRPGQSVLLYSEVQNFKSEPNEDGKFYRTMLKSNITIHRVGNSGGTVAEFQFDAAEDLCRNYRKDYFHSYEIALPENITLGPHILTLTVTDQLGDKIATETLKFNVR